MQNNIDNIDKLVIELFNKHDTWYDIINWFAKHKPKDEAIQFVWDSIFTGKYIQSIYMYKGMLKHILYLYRSTHDKTFPFEYSSQRVTMLANFWKETFILQEGTFDKHPLELRANQLYKMSKIYGFSRKDSHRLPEHKGKGIIFPVNRFWDGETRKNGKSEFLASLGVFLQLNPFKNDARPQIYASGPKDEASKIIWDKAKILVLGQPELKNEYKAVNTRRFETYAGGVFKKLPFEKGSIEGRNPSLGIITEYHLHPSDEVVESFESAMNMSRINSLLCFDTTKGTGIYGVAYNREHQYKEMIDEQLYKPMEIIGINISTFFAELDPDDDYDNFNAPWESNIFRKSTPMLGEIISLDALQQEWAISKKDPIKRREFLIKKGGKWIGYSTALFQLDDIIQCNDRFRGKYDIKKLEGEPAIISIDLAQTGDTNAITLTFKDIVDGEEVPLFFSHIFIPKQTLDDREIKERKPYTSWVENGYVSTCGKKAVDHKDIAEYIAGLLKRFKVKKILFDPYYAHIVQTYLTNQHGISESWFEEVPNNAKTLSSPIEDLVKKIVKQEAYFFDNPVSTDHILGMEPKYTTGGQIYFVKVKQKQRIDIFATIAMALFGFSELPKIGSAATVFMETWEFND